MAERGQEGGEAKGSSKKLIIMIVAAVILLAAGGGVTFFLMKGDSAKTEKEAEHHEEPVHAEMLYFDMSNKPIVVDFPQGAAAKHGRITLSVLVEGAETIEVLKKNEPMIRNNLLMLVGAQDPASLNTREGKEMLSKAMLDDISAVVVKMAGKGRVKEIFFTSFVMQ
ncbi:flagellar basal body-associated FliL family protein [Candidatus Methylobacter oryzae]|uniref:Flagellar protein FliL n=1 Tax=Candidatus Methylobacter oryzae TaxID=2497749 RepID=A0ABY3CH06_9GAMM|nr:flagellar basal body-associated FliL family protein [Candidatus Methylobacter oryzae]TRX00488.1 flagellar basal body protein FliL [Candidatus Methylobacter oryzae]